jgi:hypothetical protein
MHKNLGNIHYICASDHNCNEQHQADTYAQTKILLRRHIHRHFMKYTYKHLRLTLNISQSLFPYDN